MLMINFLTFFCQEKRKKVDLNSFTISCNVILNSNKSPAYLYSEWCEGQVTEYLVATFGDYFADVKM